MPVFNGDISALQKLMEYYPESLFIDQDSLWRELYSVHQDTLGFRNELAFYCNYGPYYAELLG